MTILFLYSPFPGSGKTTAADYLCRRHQFQKVSFATALRNISLTLLTQLGYTEQEATYYLTEGKNNPIPCLGKVTGRYLLQRLGTEFGRNMLADDIWLQAFAQLCKRIEEEGATRKGGVRLVCDDMRFLNELDYAEEVEGYTIWINRNSSIPTKPIAPPLLQKITWRVPILRKAMARRFTAHHPSNNALKGLEREFHYVVPNNSDTADFEYTLDLIVKEVFT
jgi:hypothetical protein